MDIASLLSLAAGRPGHAPRGDAAPLGPAALDFAALLRNAQGEAPAEALLAQLGQQAEGLPASHETLEALAAELAALTETGNEEGGEVVATLIDKAVPAERLPASEAARPDRQAEVVFSDPRLAEIAARLALVAGPEATAPAIGEATKAHPALVTEMAAQAGRRGGLQPLSGALERAPLQPTQGLAGEPLDRLMPGQGRAPGGERPGLTPPPAPLPPPVAQGLFSEPSIPDPSGARAMGGEALLAQGSGALATGALATGAPAMPASGQASLTAPLASQAWEQQLGQQLVSLGQRGGQIELHLNPAELGPLSVSLKLGDQGAQAQFLSAHAPVRLAVEQALPQLREALAEQGIQLGEASVGEQRGDQAGGFLANGNGTGQAGGEAQGDDEGPAMAPLEARQQASLAASLRGGVDLFA
ncbi:flagellar hook-length control protein FliK [Halomonas salifodinae]|uniref:flagellar hook-length control protein FliK n=1 Tax=Halomonas salifodinae TaxID=438745 RepID=UPI0033BB7BE4